jgi:membrane protein required for beta-lactamase induction
VDKHQINPRELRSDAGQAAGSPNQVAASVRKPSWGGLLLGLIPFVAICFTVPLWDRVYPIVVGLPFNLFWLILWIVLTPVCMWGAYKCVERKSSPSKDKTRSL